MTEISNGGLTETTACAKCGYPRYEHSYNGACYGLCGEFVSVPNDTQTTEAEVRRLARETYVKTCLDRPHMPNPDTPEGQRKIDRLFDIIWKHAQ